MTPTKKSKENEIEELATSLHLVTPQSKGKPLCGITAKDVVIGAYCEHLDESGGWCREVFGKTGKAGKACEVCLALYPSLLWGKPSSLSDFLNLHTVVTVSPYPQSLRDEFNVAGFCTNENFEIAPEPSVTGQRVMHGKVALTLMTHIVPRKLPTR